MQKTELRGESLSVEGKGSLYSSEKKRKEKKNIKDVKSVDIITLFDTLGEDLSGSIFFP